MCIRDRGSSYNIDFVTRPTIHLINIRAYVHHSVCRVKNAIMYAVFEVLTYTKVCLWDTAIGIFGMKRREKKHSKHQGEASEHIEWMVSKTKTP